MNRPNNNAVSNPLTPENLIKIISKLIRNAPIKAVSVQMTRGP